MSPYALPLHLRLSHGRNQQGAAVKMSQRLCITMRKIREQLEIPDIGLRRIRTFLIQLPALEPQFQVPRQNVPGFHPWDHTCPFRQDMELPMARMLLHKRMTLDPAPELGLEVLKNDAD